MPYQSKSEQRVARSTGVVAADRIVTSTDKPELNKMPQDNSKLTGGRIGPKGRSTTLRGSMDVSAKSSTLTGCLDGDGTTTFPFKSMTGESTRKGGQTTTEKIGRTGGSFELKETTKKGGKPSGKQGMHHHPLYGKLGK